ncbi:hypothetical protein [Bradyrhizobium icense]|uniref:hypothetical protein n=1 Tax=Bradyrhizobium icense TaxID=1274631 RepID=UPI0012EA1A85|nr:hypothetical protein [Bradyrhizobium icense]
MKAPIVGGAPENNPPEPVAGADSRAADTAFFENLEIVTRHGRERIMPSRRV